MRTKITKLIAGLTAVTALAVGGASLASAASNTKPANPPVVAVDGDTLQQGDQSTPDTSSAAESSTESTAESTAESSTESTAEPASSEQAGESSSEMAANDGPAGHADEPGNASADYQFQGEQ